MKLKLSLIATLLFFSVFAQAESYFVEKINNDDVSSADKNSVYQLVKINVTQNGQQIANSLEKANYVLTPNLLKLGESYVLSLTKSNRQTGATFSQQMKASSMSDMDMTTARVTEAVINNKSVAQTADVTNITDQETRMNKNRYEATRQWILGIGPGWTSNLRSSGGGFSFLLGYEWGLDPDFSIDVTWVTNAGQKDDNSSFSDFSFGGTKYFSRSKHSPLLGARIGYASSTVDNSCLFCAGTEQGSRGWSGGVTAGYKFFRTSTVNTSIVYRYVYIFDKGDLGNASLSTVHVIVHY